MAQLSFLLLLTSLGFNLSLADFIHEMQIEDLKSDPSPFSWKSCSTADNPLIEVKQLSISPEVITPGTMETFRAQVAVKENLTESEGLSGELSIKMKMGGEYKDLCPLLMDVCEIKDICKEIASFEASCPEGLKKQGFACKCPIPENICPNDILDKFMKICSD